MTTAKQQVMESIDPSTGKLIAQFPLITPAQLEHALAEAARASHEWRFTSFDDRAAMIKQASAYLIANKERFAALITSEMGKPIGQAEAEIEKCAWNCDFYAENAALFLADEPHAASSAESYVAFDPLGTVLAIMPWNFPFWQLFRFAAPALMAGNTALLKHASNVPRCALAISETFQAAGLPRGVFQTLLVSGSMATGIVGDPRVAAVTLTGSDATGAVVAAAAGKAIKKTVLELGGSDPFLVLADADLDAAAEHAARSRFQNAGQSCIAAKRIIVVEPAADAFLRCLEERVSALKVGDPSDRSTDVGPMARADLRNALHALVETSVKQGARLVLGGHKLDGRGYFYEPTIIAEVTPNMAVFREETFGPVAAVIRARDVDHAIALANDTKYGLGANLWTSDLAAAKRLARRVDAGSVFINGVVASDPRLPFGGIKRSGYGRELSVFGIREFTNVKTIVVGPPQAPPLHRSAPE